MNLIHSARARRQENHRSQQWVLMEDEQIVLRLDARLVHIQHEHSKAPAYVPVSPVYLPSSPIFDSPNYSPSSPVFDSPNYSPSSPKYRHCECKLQSHDPWGPHYHPPSPHYFPAPDHVWNSPICELRTTTSILEKLQNPITGLFNDMWKHHIIPLLEDSPFALRALGTTCRTMAALIIPPVLPIDSGKRFEQALAEHNHASMRIVMRNRMGYDIQHGTTRRGIYLLIDHIVMNDCDLPLHVHEKQGWMEVRSKLVQLHWDDSIVPFNTPIIEEPQVQQQQQQEQQQQQQQQEVAEDGKRDLPEVIILDD